jgi:pSer/pThr/pTyr-binding forkhead associated (FHA) protein
MKAQIVCRVRPGVTQVYDVKGQEAVIGREPGGGIPIPMEGVSRQHARIVFDGKAYILEDMKSTNGTYLNGQGISREKLYHLDVIGLGRKADLVFVLRAEGAAPLKKTGVVRAALVPDGAEAQAHEVPVGEVILGRSSASNIVVESTAVSKLHARVVRTPDQLLLEDMGSSNGTFVNGNQVMTAVLRDGDTIALGGVAVFRVALQMGEVEAAPSESRVIAAAPAPGERPRFSADWRTRFEWDSSEYEQIAEIQKMAREKEVRDRAAKGAAAKPGAPAAEAKPAAAAKPAAPAAKPAAPAAPKPAAPAAPAAAKPAAPAPAAPAPAPKPAPAPPPAAAAPAPAPPAPKPPAPKPPAPAAAAPAPPKPAPPAAEEPSPPTVMATAQELGQAPAPAPAGGAISEVRLVAPGFDVFATASGAHDLGRAKEAPLRVNHPTVSRTHARLIISDDRSIAYIQDRGGANGTRLNGAPIDKLQVIKNGDIIGVGEVLLTVSIKRG